MQRIMQGTVARSARTVAPNQESYLWKLTRECSNELKKLELNQKLPEKIRAIQGKYALNLRLEAEEVFKHIDIDAVDDSPEALGMALAWDIAHFLDYMPNFMSDYCVTTSQMELAAAISPRHRQFLMRSFKETFEKLSTEDRIKLVIAIDSKAMDAMECQLTPEEKRLQSTAHHYVKQIDLNQLFSMIDYTHVDTSQFVPVNCGQRLARYAGIQIAADIVSCVSQPMVDALKTLVMNPDFVYHGDLFKGVYLINPAGPFRRSCLVNGKTHILAHATSATSDPEQSYANPPIRSWTDPRDTNLVFKNVWGVRVHLFNDWSTTNQKEVLIMPTMAIRSVPAPVGASNGARPGSKQTYYCEFVNEASGYQL